MSEQATKLGQSPPPEARRDAIHVAVVPVVAGQTLQAGEHVQLLGGQAFRASSPKLAIGIVDPWCGGVSNGARFWLCLKPGTVSNLRHAWAHPAFPLPVGEEEAQPPSEREASKAWLAGWCRAFWPIDETENILGYLLQAIDEGEICFGITSYYNALEGSEDEGTLTQEFWTHYERYTGKTRPKHALQFRCAC